MKNLRPLIILLALITVIGISLGTFTFLHRAAREQVYVYNCGIVDYKPQSLTPYCADANAGVGNFEWNTWDSSGATGTGLYSLNLCEPNCAQGKWKYAEVNVRLSKSVRAKGKIVLTRIDIVTKDGKNLPNGKSPSFGWDLESKPLSDFAP